MSSVFLTIIICTRNRADEVNDCLVLVTKQAKLFNDIEVVVVDNGSADNTKDVVKNISGEFDFIIRYIYEPIFGLCQARNRGREIAGGKVLAYIDDDVRIGNEWIAQIRQHFIEKRSDCLGGKVCVRLGGKMPLKSSPELHWFFGETDYGDQTREYRESDRVPYPVGCNMAFTTDVFDAVGGFNTNLKLYFDETDFFRRVKQKKFKMLYVPEVKVEQFIPADRLKRRELRKKTYLLGKGAAIFWLLTAPSFAQQIKKIGLIKVKVFYHFFRYLIKPDFGKFFALWFNFSYIVQLFRQIKK